MLQCIVWSLTPPSFPSASHRSASTRLWLHRSLHAYPFQGTRAWLALTPP